MDIHWELLVLSLVYSAIGVGIFMVAYKVIAAFLPFDLNKELAEDQNTAVGIVVGSVMIGLAIIIASAIHG
jgi:putative membrane protein